MKVRTLMWSVLFFGVDRGLSWSVVVATRFALSALRLTALRTSDVEEAPCGRQVYMLSLALQA